MGRFESLMVWCSSIYLTPSIVCFACGSERSPNPTFFLPSPPRVLERASERRRYLLLLLSISLDHTWPRRRHRRLLYQRPPWHRRHQRASVLSRGTHARASISHVNSTESINKRRSFVRSRSSPMHRPSSLSRSFDCWCSSSTIVSIVPSP